MSRRARIYRQGQPLQPMTADEKADMQARISDLTAIDFIERNTVAMPLSDAEWRDTRPVLDIREVSPATVDQARAALEHGIERGLFIRHAQQQHLVRIARRPL
jgi:hypothetical protein